jgi:(E)-4-hydroxy-3-methylbut-2-enyl-diphosphate synthase
LPVLHSGNIFITMIERKKTRQVHVRGVAIGGGAPIVIQSMTNTDTCDVEATLAQIGRLTAAGCRIVRVAVPDDKAADAFAEIRKKTDVPLVADIHFQYQLAIKAIEAGADKIRINPGNIGTEERIRKVVDAARAARIPLRIGVNAGSLEKPLLERYGSPSPRALLESCLGSLALVRGFGFQDIIVSLKASSAAATIEACRLFAAHSDAPQHIGVTESGTVRSGSIRSAVGIGALLAEGIGDTIRVSLAGDPVEEVPAAKEILKALGLMPGPVVIACPTCGRTRIDVAGLADKVERMVAPLKASLRIAVMGCVVNGPGEARDADIGIAGGDGDALLFVKGQAVKKVKENQVLAELKKHIEEMTKEKL